MEPIVLYTDKFWISPYVFSCFVALHEKALPFETRALSLGDGEQHRMPFRDRSVTARVPALEHGDFMVAESSAILEYLEDAFPPPSHARLLPEAPRERARARQVMGWLRSDLGALREERPTTTMFYERTTATPKLSPTAQQAADKLVRVTELLLGERSAAPDAFSIADAELAFALMRLGLNGDPLPPKVRAFADAVWARPAVRAFAARERPAFVPY